MNQTCLNCGAKLYINYKFCNKCGTKVLANNELKNSDEQPGESKKTSNKKYKSQKKPLKKNVLPESPKEKEVTDENSLEETNIPSSDTSVIGSFSDNSPEPYPSLNELDSLIYFEETITESNIIADINNTINNWGNNIPNHDLNNIGDLIEIMSVINNPVYKFELISSIDERSLIREAKPYENEELPKAKIKPENIDLWTEEKKNHRNFEEYSKKIIYEQTREVKNCTPCHSSGTIKCEKCNGRGRLGCSDCNRTGRVRCSSCSGSGRCSNCNGTGSYKGWSDDNYKHCTRCSGTGSCPECHQGYKTCRDCEGVGYVGCNSCDNAGTVTCDNCEGQGKILCYLSNQINVHNNISATFINENFGSSHIANFLDEVKSSKPKLIFKRDQKKFKNSDAQVVTNDKIRDAIICLFDRKITNESEANVIKKEKKTLLESVIVYRYDYLFVKYQYNEKEYAVFIIGEGKKIISNGSPIDDIMLDYLTQAEKNYLESNYERANKLISKYMVMNKTLIEMAFLVSNLKTKLTEIDREYDDPKHLLPVPSINNEKEWALAKTLNEVVPKYFKEQAKNIWIEKGLDTFIVNFPRWKNFEAELKTWLQLEDPDDNKVIIEIVGKLDPEALKGLLLHAKIDDKLKLIEIARLYEYKEFKQTYIKANELYNKNKNIDAKKFLNRARMVLSIPVLIINLIISTFITTPIGNAFAASSLETYEHRYDPDWTQIGAGITARFTINHPEVMWIVFTFFAFKFIWWLESPRRGKGAEFYSSLQKSIFIRILEYFGFSLLIHIALFVCMFLFFILIVFPIINIFY